jgi:23S rRNA (uracil1939-C5)-methyltransferase
LKKVPVEKNKEYVVDIIDNGFEGEGIAKIDNFTIFIPSALKGEKVKILIVKVLSSHAFGKIIDIIKKSPYRVEPDCVTYKRCGGCNLRHVDYEETLNMKQNAVQSLVNKTLKNKIEVKPTVAMGNPYHYRNKLQFPIGVSKETEPVIGVFANRTHEIVPIEGCALQDKKAIQISKYVIDVIKEYNLSIYDEKTGLGLMRHVVIKTAKATDEYMVILVINGDKLPHTKEIATKLQGAFPGIVSVIVNINKKNTNVILGEKNITVCGKDYIVDRLGDYYFKISPLSFYQVNPVQAEAMYNYAIEAAEISKNDVVFDLYCGIGTISIFMAKFAKEVYGVEIIEQAIDMAKENAVLNEIDNTHFIAGDTEVILTDLIKNKEIRPDVIVVDPPRKGLDNTTVNNILEVMPRRVVYISCNPASLVRDLEKLEEKYVVGCVQPFDMFPFTSHVETISVLELK